MTNGFLEQSAGALVGALVGGLVVWLTTRRQVRASQRLAWAMKAHEALAAFTQHCDHSATSRPSDGDLWCMRSSGMLLSCLLRSESRALPEAVCDLASRRRDRVDRRSYLAAAPLPAAERDAARVEREGLDTEIERLRAEQYAQHADLVRVVEAQIHDATRGAWLERIPRAGARPSPR